MTAASGAALGGQKSVCRHARLKKMKSLSVSRESERAKHSETESVVRISSFL